MNLLRAVANFGVKFNKRRPAGEIYPNQHLQTPFSNWRVAVGDLVEVRWGTDRRKRGKVLRLDRKANTVVVEGVNLQTKMASSSREEGSDMKATPMPLHVSRVGLVDPTTQKVGRVFFGFTESGEKVRVFKKSGTILPKEKPYKSRVERLASRADSPSDTPGDEVLEVTYQGEDFEQIRAEFDRQMREKEEREKLLIFR